MREILFRGKQVEIGPFATESVCEWVYGGYAQDSSGTYIYDFMRPKRMVKVDPATVGQCTGLKDRNEKKIFEGDIVEGYDFDAEDGYGIVRWDDGAFEVVGSDFFGTFHENYLGTGFKVIGNIYDNPELLEEEMS